MVGLFGSLRHERAKLRRDRRPSACRTRNLQAMPGTPPPNSFGTLIEPIQPLSQRRFSGRGDVCRSSQCAVRTLFLTSEPWRVSSVNAKSRGEQTVRTCDRE
jgi:hypothetical protein